MTCVGKVSWAGPAWGWLLEGGLACDELEEAGVLQSWGTLFPLYVPMRLWELFSSLTPLISYLFNILFIFTYYSICIAYIMVCARRSGAFERGSGGRRCGPLAYVQFHWLADVLLLME